MTAQSENQPTTSAISALESLSISVESLPVHPDQEIAAAQGAARRYCDTYQFPTGHDELWRYTKPTLFPWKQLSEITPAELTLTVFGNDAASVPSGVTLGCDGAVVTKLVNQKILFVGNPVIDGLQLALATNVRTIKVSKSEGPPQPIFLSQALSGSAVTELYIEVESGASCTFIEDLDCATEGFVMPQTQVLLNEGSSAEFISLQRLPPTASYYGRFRFFLKRDAKLKTLFAALGAQIARVDLDCVMLEQNAEAHLGTLYLVDGKRHVDFHTEQQHMAPACYSNLQCKGAARDASRGVYFGFIRVAEGAQKTDAYQKAKTMLLSKHARADNIPNLEIKANDVKCSHGASVAQVGGEELFYLKSRGISQETAEILLLQGFFEDVCQKVSNKNIQEYVMARIMERM